VGVAPADTVLVDDRFAEAIADNSALAIEPHGHQRLKGLGSVHASRLRPSRIS
jgi:class 3 adenylate cyclase